MSIGGCRGCCPCLGGYERLDLSGSDEDLSSNGDSNKPKNSLWKSFCNFFKRYQDPSDILTPEQVEKVQEAAKRAGESAVGFMNAWYGEERECSHHLKIRGSAEKQRYKIKCSECKYKFNISDERSLEKGSCGCFGCCFGEKEPKQFDPEKTRAIREAAKKVGNAAVSVLNGWLDQDRLCQHNPEVYKSRYTADYKIQCPECEYSVIIEDLRSDPPEQPKTLKELGLCNTTRL